VLRATLRAEQAGIPAVAIVGSLFERQARAVSRLMGVEEARLAVYPGRIPMDDEAELRRKFETVIADQVVAGLTGDPPRAAEREREPGPREIVLSGTLDEVNDVFYERLWTDGLPIVPPTPDRVQRFLRYTDRGADEVIGVLLPESREATVWNVAVTGVMAGCLPEYMPVLIAIAEAVADPAFQLADGGSGVGWEPLIMLSGPLIKELDFHYGTGVKRVGRRANTSVGRFLRLLTRNIAGLRVPPGTTDKGGIGSTFHVVLPEDEDAVRAVGWPTLGEDLGVPAGHSAVTVQSVMAESSPFGEFGGSSDDPQTYLYPLVEFFGKGLLGYWVGMGLHYEAWHPIVLLSPHCVRVLASHDWTKPMIREHLHRESKVRAGFVEALGAYTGLDIPRMVREGRLPPEYHESDDPERLISTFVRPENLRIICAGNPDMYWQRGFMNNHTHGAPVTRVIQPVPGWQDLTP
jgi:hypothetical protein